MASGSKQQKFGGACKPPYQTAIRAARVIYNHYRLKVPERFTTEGDRLRQALIMHDYVSPLDGEDHMIDPKRMEKNLREQEPVFALEMAWCGEEARRE